jgi:serine/threonine protein kinase
MSSRSYGRYELIERVAVGGMGEIWRAKLTGLEGFEKTVAIKKILPHLSDDPKFVERLVVEAKIAVALSHANVVEVYELGTVEGEYYISMEYVDGPDLATLLHRAERQDRSIPQALSIHLGTAICKSLDYAHRKVDESGKPMNIVHRDVSPQNILLSMEGAVKLSDFGIARAAGLARLYHTDMGVVLGKRRYMAPEQRRGEKVDSRADVFAAGAILYEMVAGAPPEEVDPPPPSQIAEAVPAELDDIIMAALEGDPTNRPTAGVIAQRLDRLYPKLRETETPPPPDPTMALAAFIREVYPGEQSTGSRRSLTELVNAAMGRHDELGPGADRPVTGSLPKTGEVEVSPAVSEITHDEPEPVVDEDGPTNETTNPAPDWADHAGDTSVLVTTANATWNDGTRPGSSTQLSTHHEELAEGTPTSAQAEIPGEPETDAETKPTSVFEPPTARSRIRTIDRTQADTNAPAEEVAFDPPTQPSRFLSTGGAMHQDTQDPLPDTTRAPSRPARRTVDVYPGVPKVRVRAGVRTPMRRSRLSEWMRYFLDAPEARTLRALFLIFAAILAIALGVGLASVWY